MGKFIRLDTAITDLTAPVLPHAAGVAGFRNRYFGSAINAAVESVVSKWDDAKGTTALTNFSGTPKNVLKDEAGMRFIRSNTGAVDGGRLHNTAAGVAAAFSYAVVMRKPAAGGSDIMGVNGVNLERASNGAWAIRNFTYAPTGTNALAGWVCAIVQFDGAAASLYVNNGAGGFTGAAPGASYAANNTVFFGAYPAATEADLAEFTVWPKLLTADERTKVFAAMKTKYPALTY